MNMHNLKLESMFTAQDRQRVAEAVAQAEANTSGEIVPLIVNASDAYPHADLVAGICGQLFFLIIGFWFFPLFSHWAITLLLAGGFAAGYLLSRQVPMVKRFLIGQRVAEHEVRQRAMQAFVEHNLAGTRDRTGILLMISLLEQRVQVLADEGIHAKVPAGTWDAVVRLMLERIRQGAPIDGLVAGIARCGEILSKEFPKKPDDINEISDKLLVE